MAKLEAIAVKKLKGKKRKHTNGETEDEVANKSVIVEAKLEESKQMQTNTESELVLNTKKSKKRKNKDKGEISEKRSKRQQHDICNIPPNKDHEVEDDLNEPTPEQLKESKKPENTLAIVTGRQKKKQKHQNLVDAKKGQSAEKDKHRNEEYLNKWKNSRDSWKFEKLRQISIQQTMFDKDKLNANFWPIALEYLAGTKGSAKDKIVKLANEAIEEVDKACEQHQDEQTKQSIVDSVKYQRARDFLQLFD